VACPAKGSPPPKLFAAGDARHGVRPVAGEQVSLA
jgi:hypothetical protein